MPILDAVEAALEQHESDAIAAAVASLEATIVTGAATLQAVKAADAAALQAANDAASAQAAADASTIANLQAQLAAVPPPALTVPRPTLMLGDIDLPAGEYHNVIFTGLVKWLGPSLLEDCSWDLQPGANFGAYANLIGPKTKAVAAAGGLVGRRWRMNGHGLSAFLNGIGGAGFAVDDVEIFGTVDGIHQDTAGTSKVTNLRTHDGTLIKGTAVQTGQSDGVTHGDSVQLLVGHLDVDQATLAGYSNSGIKVGATTVDKVSGAFTNIAIADGVPVAGINIDNVGGHDDLAGISFDAVSFAPTKHGLFLTYGTVNPKLGRMVDSAGNLITPKKMS